MKQVMRSVLLLGMILSTCLACSSESAVSPLGSIPTSSEGDRTGTTDIAPISSGNLTTIAESTVPLTLPTTTTPASTPGPPCTIDAIQASVGPPPAGITDIDLRCVGDWASWVGKPDDPTKFDAYFAVARRSATTWTTVNLGTAGVCVDGGVPPDLWTALNCTE